MTSTSDSESTAPVDETAAVEGTPLNEETERVAASDNIEATAAPSDTTPDEDDEIVLTPKLDPRWAPSLGHVLLVAACCFFFLLLDFLPLRSAELWSQVEYGKWILEHGKLPSEDPFMAFAEGMRVVDSQWLTQVILALVARGEHQDPLCDLFAVTVMLTFLLLGWTYYRQVGKIQAAAMGTLAVLLISWSYLTTLRPIVLGGLCFAVLLRLIVSCDDCAASSEDAGAPGSKWPLRVWVGVPLLLALWANLHTSFICGVAVLGCYFVGRVIEVAWRTKSVRGVFSDRSVRRWLFLTELGVAATLVNPYGIDLWLELLWFGERRNLREILDWQQISLLSAGGREFGLSIAVLVVVLRHSRRRIPVAHGLLLATFALAAVAQRRMLFWYAPVFGLVLTPHIAELLARAEAWRAKRRPQPTVVRTAVNDGELPPGRSWRYLLVCGLLVWIAFAFSGLSRPILGGKPRTPQQLYGSSFPLGATEYLRENPPNGQVFSPHLWGDWLIAHGPPDVAPFITSQVQYAPRQVWQDYRRVSFAQADWEGVLNRYRVNTLIVDKERQLALVGQLRSNEDWTSRYEDEQALIVARVRRSVDDDESDTGKSDTDDESDTNDESDTDESETEATEGDRTADFPTEADETNAENNVDQ